MSSITACPQCQTRFRVTEEQLGMRNGNVRCGRCAHVFNALESLIEESPLLPADVPDPAQQPGLEEQAQEVFPAAQTLDSPEPEVSQPAAPPETGDTAEPLFELDVNDSESQPETEEALFELEITQPEAPADADWPLELFPDAPSKEETSAIEPVAEQAFDTLDKLLSPEPEPEPEPEQSQSQSQSQKVKLKPNLAWSAFSRRPPSFNPRFHPQAQNMRRPPSPGEPGHGPWPACYCWPDCLFRGFILSVMPLPRTIR